MHPLMCDFSTCTHRAIAIEFREKSIEKTATLILHAYGQIIDLALRNAVAQEDRDS
jgi:hypothetical protein